MLGVNFFVYDADGFTRKYFREELKCELGPAIDVTVLVPHPPAAPVPPPTGYGTETDSMTSVKCIVPKQRIEQYKRSTELDGKCLRFLARLVEPLVPGQKERLFCIQYYLGDEEVMVTELSQRNVGVAGRKFLQRGKYVDDNGMHFKAEYFVLGAEVRINKHPFQIIDADRFTKTYLETGHVDKASSDLYLVLERLRDSMKERLTCLRDVFRRIDQDKNGVITADELKNSLLTVGYELSGEEEITLLNHFDTSQNQQVNYVEFCDALLNLELASPFKYSRNRPPLPRPTNSGCDPAFAQREKALQEADATRRAVREIASVLPATPTGTQDFEGVRPHVRGENGQHRAS
ncbi:efhc1 [Cystoisospora suis]|uniref:Efhc1 n=1 Tax=Cystoisospora suis TaxID=483139 RepID=A0A2C6L8U5_9APIC|nr:efhc1 [Cystoisospora suis]